MTESTEVTPPEAPQMPTLSNEELTAAITNVAAAVGQTRMVVQQVVAAIVEINSTTKAHKEAIVKVSQEVNRLAEEKTAMDARIDVVRSWLKSLGPEPKPLTGVEND